MDFRSQAILSALQYIKTAYPEEPLYAIEIGCMFKEDEGLSTFFIADFLARNPAGGRFISIDYELRHIEACKQLIKERNPALNQYIDYQHGHSLQVLPKIIAELPTLHFFLLDGGAHPEVCLVEFELAIAQLSPEGVLLVDDAHQLAPTPNYSLPRPFGKATHILPMLMFSQYIKNRDQFLSANSARGESPSIPESYFIRQLKRIDISSVVLANWSVLGTKHKILAYGNPTFLTQVTKALEPLLKNEPESLKTLIKKIMKKILRML